MGGAFLARADDATAASWNPAGLSYLRLPELSLVGVSNSFDATRGDDFDRFDGKAVDFAAFTWPVAFGETHGAVQVSYQRAISFDGRAIDPRRPGPATAGQTTADRGRRTERRGLRRGRLRHRPSPQPARAGRGDREPLAERLRPDPRPPYLTPSARPLREFDLDFRTEGWSFNLGVMFSPVEQLNLAAVYKTPFTAVAPARQGAARPLGIEGSPEEVTTNASSSDAARLDLPSSLGFGVSWRPRDTLTLSADFTRTRWSEARILDYFELVPTPPTDDGIAGGLRRRSPSRSCSTPRCGRSPTPTASTSSTPSRSAWASSGC